MKNIIRLFILFPLLLAGCYNKNLCPECETEESLSIRFDWNQVPPQPLMTTLVYNTQGQLVKTLELPEGGAPVSLDPGKYTIVTYNSSSASQWSGQNSLSTLHVTAPDGSEAGEKGSSAYICGATKKDVVVSDTDGGSQVISLTPQQITDHYSYQISGLSGVTDGIQVQSVSLSGLNDGYFPDGNTGSVSSCTVPFTGNTIDSQSGTITGSMNCFGPSPGKTNNVTINILYNGKPLSIPAQDVTTQISGASDPHNVTIHIELHIIKIGPDVEDWIIESETIVL